MFLANKKQYTSPSVIAFTFDCNDVITASNDDNLGGIPLTWIGGTRQGGDFE